MLGSGYRGIDKIYKTNFVVQRGGAGFGGGSFRGGENYLIYSKGKGLSSFFSNVYSLLKPLALKAAQTLGNELFTSGANISSKLGDEKFSDLFGAEKQRIKNSLKQKALNKFNATLTRVQKGGRGGGGVSKLKNMSSMFIPPDEVRNTLAIKTKSRKGRIGIANQVFNRLKRLQRGTRRTQRKGRKKINKRKIKKKRSKSSCGKKKNCCGGKRKRKRGKSKKSSEENSNVLFP